MMHLALYTIMHIGQQECGGLECGGCISDSPKNVWCSEGVSILYINEISSLDSNPPVS